MRRRLLLSNLIFVAVLLVVLEVPLQAAESVGTGSMPGRAFDAATELVLGLFRAGFKRL